MWLRLRQICLVSDSIEQVTEDLQSVFGIAVCHIDSAVHQYGLENRLFPIGNQFLEVVAPTREGTAAGRYLARRGGDGGYMVITQCDDLAPREQRVETLGVRIANRLDYDDFHGIQLHPRDTGGAFFEIDQQLGDTAPDGPWHPAGPDWATHRRTEVVESILAAELQSPEPMNLARRWAEIAELELQHDERGVSIALENASVRFVSARDSRGEGLAALDLKARDADAARSVAQARGLLAADGAITICGTRFYLR